MMMMMMKPLILLIVVTLISFVIGGAANESARAPQSAPWMNQTLSPLRSGELMVEQMTLDEMILHIHLFYTLVYPREVSAFPRLGIPALKITNAPAGAGVDDSRQTP